MKSLLDKKQGMSISIILFVLMVIILFTTAITLFYLRDKTIKADTKVSPSIDEVTYKETLLNFYLTQMARDTDKSSPVISFKHQLARYNLDSVAYVILELSDIEKQSDEKHILVDNGKLKINFATELSYQLVDSKNKLTGMFSKLPYTFSYISS